MDEAMTALERELLGYVERLASACEISTRNCAAEARSTGQIERRLDGLADCVGLLLRSQGVGQQRGRCRADPRPARHWKAVARKRASESAERRLNAK